MATAKRSTSVCRPGDLLRIPYDAERAIYGRVVHCDAPGVPRQRHRGLYLTVLDRDVEDGLTPEAIAASPVMLGPFFTIVDPMRKGDWTVVGHVDAGDAELPYFMGSRGLVNYHHEPVDDTLENAARVVSERVASPNTVRDVIRAKRGLEQWYPGYDLFLPGQNV
jgi:hypothetical protein